MSWNWPRCFCGYHMFYEKDCPECQDAQAFQEHAKKNIMRVSKEEQDKFYSKHFWTKVNRNDIITFTEIKPEYCRVHSDLKYDYKEYEPKFYTVNMKIILAYIGANTRNIFDYLKELIGE